jgi:uncharacterized protein (DUF2147 family)
MLSDRLWDRAQAAVAKREVMRSFMYALVLAWVPIASPAAAAIKGHWTNPSESVVVGIAPCGHALCGTVTWASDKAKHDARKGTQHLVGSHLLTDLKKSNDTWRGRLFVPDQNMRVSAKLQLVTADEMKVSGCALKICKSQIWKRTHQRHRA